MSLYGIHKGEVVELSDNPHFIEAFTPPNGADKGFIDLDHFFGKVLPVMIKSGVNLFSEYKDWRYLFRWKIFKNN